MKTFADVKFNDVSGVLGTIDLNNGYEIVVTMTIFGRNKGMWQLAVFPKNNPSFSLFMKCLGNYNLSDYLTFNELEKKITEVQKELNM